MLLHEFMSRAAGDPPKVKNPGVKCNALSKTPKSFNCNLLPQDAIQLADNLRKLAQVVIDNEIIDAAVQIYNIGESSETLSLGLIKARKGPKKKIRMLNNPPD